MALAWGVVRHIQVDLAALDTAVAVRRKRVVQVHVAAEVAVFCIPVARVGFGTAVVVHHKPVVQVTVEVAVVRRPVEWAVFGMARERLPAELPG
ncbi:MAG: hypothetical protein E4H27_10285 [Anaerolineales bacterium]|nr:MAG: hypothetical protein E4H27_10285 [Anaerolineales bacterium]